jgi:DNA-binding XRE family transcriptional regulator
MLVKYAFIWTMTTAHAISLFGSRAKLARALGISRQATYLWGRDIPPLRAYQIRELLNKQKSNPANA